VNILSGEDFILLLETLIHPSEDLILSTQTFIHLREKIHDFHLTYLLLKYE